MTDRQNDVGRRYANAAVHTGVGGILSRILQGFAPIILARYLGPKEYGVYALILSLVGIVAGVSHLGQNAALQKFLPEYFVKDRARGGAILADTIIIVSAALSALCLAFYYSSAWIASSLYHDASLAVAFQLSALLVLAMSLFNLASSAVAGLQDFRAYSLAMILRSAGLLVLAWLGVAFFGLYGALLGQVLAGFFGLALLTVPALKVIRSRFPGVVRPVLSASILKEIFNFGLPALLAGLLVSPALWWANTLLARRAGFEQVGLFGVAFVLAQLIMLVPSNLSIPAVSFMSEVHATGDRDRFSHLVSANLRLVWAVTLPIAAGCALMSPLLIGVIFGEAFLGAVPLAAIMSFSALLIVVNSVIGYAIAAAGQMWHAFAINFLWLVIFVGFTAILVPSMGAFGLAIACASSYMIFTAAVGLYSRWLLGVRFENVPPLVLLTVLGFAASAVVLMAWSAWHSFVATLVVVPLIVLGGLKWVLADDECASLLRSRLTALRTRYG